MREDEDEFWIYCINEKLVKAKKGDARNREETSRK